MKKSKSMMKQKENSLLFVILEIKSERNPEEGNLHKSNEYIIIHTISTHFFHDMFMHSSILIIAF